MEGLYKFKVMWRRREVGRIEIFFVDFSRCVCLGFFEYG